MSLPPLDFTGISGFTARSGGSASGLLSHNGDFLVKITTATPGISKQGNAQVTFVCIIQDEDNKGIAVKSWVPYAGNNKNGEPNAKRLWEVLDSAGTTQEQFAKLEGQQLDIAEVCNLLAGRDAHVNCIAEEYNGRWSSKINYWVSKQRYEDQKAVGAHRTPLPMGAGVNKQNGAAASVTAAPVSTSVISTASAGNPLL
jgi:hypothetical protein